MTTQINTEKITYRVQVSRAKTATDPGEAIVTREGKLFRDPLLMFSGPVGTCWEWAEKWGKDTRNARRHKNAKLAIVSYLNDFGTVTVEWGTV